LRAVVRDFPIWGCPQYNSNAIIFYFLYDLLNAGFTFKVHIKGLHSHEISDVLKDTLLADVIVCE
jgi:hypothetical protein